MGRDAAELCLLEHADISVKRDCANLITSNPLTVDPNLGFRMLRGPYERFDSKLIILTENSYQCGLAFTRVQIVRGVEQLAVNIQLTDDIKSGGTLTQHGRFAAVVLSTDSL
jgi:hypothetical protein